MMLTANAPFYDGKGDSFSGYTQRFELWIRATSLEPVKTAAALISKMGLAVREVCMAAGATEFRPRME